MLGEYIVVCLVFVVSSLLEFALIVLLNRNAGVKKSQVTSDPNVTKEKNDSSSENEGVAKIAFVEDHSNDTCLSNTADQELVNEMKRDKGCISSMSPIHVIDLTASFIFPLAFVMYNFFYWSRSSEEGKLNG